MRRRPDQPGTLLGVRLQPEVLAKLDAWIAQQPPPFPSRPEAVRRLMEIGLAQHEGVGRNGNGRRSPKR
jgi:metal-responsive CopG/Arc/MetJ family transcriptional regulator